MFVCVHRQPPSQIHYCLLPWQMQEKLHPLIGKGCGSQDRLNLSHAVMNLVSNSLMWPHPTWLHETRWSDGFWRTFPSLDTVQLTLRLKSQPFFRSLSIKLLTKRFHTHHTWMIKVVFPCIGTLSLFLSKVLVEGVLTDHHHLFLVRVQVCLTKLLHDVLTHWGLEGRGGRKEGRRGERGKKEGRRGEGGQRKEERREKRRRKGRRGSLCLNNHVVMPCNGVM